MAIDIITFSTFACALIFISLMIKTTTDDKFSIFFSTIILVLYLLIELIFIFI